LLDKYLKRNNLASGATKTLPGGVGAVDPMGLFGNNAATVNPVAKNITGDKKEIKDAKDNLELLQERITKITLALKLQALAAIEANKAFAPDPETIKLLEKLNEQLRFC